MTLARLTSSPRGPSQNAGSFCRASWSSAFANPFDAGRHCSGLESFTGTREAPVHNFSGESTAPNDELPHNPVDHNITPVHAEVQQRLGAVIILYKYRWLLCFGGEAQAGMYSVVRSGYRLNG
jgi:hypothetical protein